MSVADLIYDWNTVAPELRKPDRHIGFDDETLRDGLQSPSVCEPPVEKKIELLHLMNELGIDTADIGLPGAGGTHAAGVELMAREIAEKKLKDLNTTDIEQAMKIIAGTAKNMGIEVK